MSGVPVLEVEGLRKGFRGPDGVTTPIVDVARFALGQGEQVALRGGSGSGKTTFLNLIAGILRADEGRISIDGARMDGLGEAARDGLRAERIGYVFQTFNLLQGYTALENVEMAMRFGGGVDRGRAKHLLERMGLGGRVNYRPRQLSVGQQQRVAVARALANRPRLVLADEPTGNLDRAHAREALGLIREVCGEVGAALLLVSHDEDVLGAFENRLDFGELNGAFAAHDHGLGAAGSDERGGRNLGRERRAAESSGTDSGNGAAGEVAK